MSFLNNLTSTNATAIGVGPSGSTNPVFAVDCSVASAATGVKATGRAAAAGADINVVSSGTNEDLRINAKGTGKLGLQSAATGVAYVGTPATPAFQVDPTAGSAATGVQVTAAAAASGVDLKAISSGTNENLTINAKGSGSIDLNPTGTGNVTTPRALLSRGATAGIGYATGAGGAVTQITSRSTGVTLNTICGAITLVSAAGSATPASFTVTNSAVAATDVVDICQKSGTDLYQVFITAVAAGSFRVTFFTTGGTTTEQPVFNFCITKAVAA